MELFHNEPTQLFNTFPTEGTKQMEISREEFFNTRWLKAMLVGVSNVVDKTKG